MRGQISLTAFILSVALVALVFPIVGSLLKENAKEQAPSLPESAESAVDILSGRGVPESWDSRTVKKPGLVKNSELLETRLIEFQQIPYAKTKELLGLGSEDYAFILLEQNGKLLLVGDKQSFGWKADNSIGNGAVEWDRTWGQVNDAALNLIKVERAVTYQGNPVKIVLYVWSGKYLTGYTLIPACRNGVDDDQDGFSDFPWDPGCVSTEDPTEYDAPAFPQCFDGVDNDGDFLIDYGADPGCDSAADNDEFNSGLPECSDRVDNDGDSLADFLDPGCIDPKGFYNPSDDSELNSVSVACMDGTDNDFDSKIDQYDCGCWTNDFGLFLGYAPQDTNEAYPFPTPTCSDGLDNDFDGWADYPYDPACSSPCATTETDAGTPPQCSNGNDDDNDLATDFPDDPGCLSAADDDENNAASAPICSDTLDNDADSLIDYPNDPGCLFASDSDETDVIVNCNDGLDNDGDGLIDYPNDPGCTSPSDTSEFNYGSTACSDGIDNNGDGLIDYPLDPHCVSSSDNSEYFSGGSQQANTCGDGSRAPGYEQCDSGQTQTITTIHQSDCGSWPPDEANYACSSQCTWQYQGGTSGVCQPADTCGQGESCEGCSCVSYCGNKKKGPAEECDPPGSACGGTGTCSAACNCEVCGNGRIDPLEMCEVDSDCSLGLTCQGCACLIPGGGGSGAGCAGATPPVVTGSGGNGNACLPDDCPVNEVCLSHVVGTGGDGVGPSDPNYGVPICRCEPESTPING